MWMQHSTVVQLVFRLSILYGFCRYLFGILDVDAMQNCSKTSIQIINIIRLL